MFRHVAVAQLILRHIYVLMHHLGYRDMMGSDSSAVSSMRLPNARSNLEANNSIEMNGLQEYEVPEVCRGARVRSHTLLVAEWVEECVQEVGTCTWHPWLLEVTVRVAAVQH